MQQEACGMRIFRRRSSVKRQVCDWPIPPCVTGGSVDSMSEVITRSLHWVSPPHPTSLGLVARHGLKTKLGLVALKTKNCSKEAHLEKFFFHSWSNPRSMHILLLFFSPDDENVAHGVEIDDKRNESNALQISVNSSPSM